MKKIIITIVLLSFPVFVSAKNSFSLNEDKNVLSVVGECQDKNIKIELYPSGKGEAVYTSNIACQNGKFEFSDNLLQWKNLRDGKYEVVVNGDVNDVKNIEIKRPVQKTSENNNAKESNSSSVENNAVEEAVSPENKFLKAFVTLQQTILNMKIWLAETNYPTFVKTSVSISLDGVDLAIGKVSDLILSGEVINAKPSVETKSLESVANVPETQEAKTQSENEKTVVAEEANVPVQP